MIGLFSLKKEVGALRCALACSIDRIEAIPCSFYVKICVEHDAPLPAPYAGKKERVPFLHFFLFSPLKRATLFAPP